MIGLMTMLKLAYNRLLPVSTLFSLLTILTGLHYINIYKGRYNNA